MIELEIESYNTWTYNSGLNPCGEVYVNTPILITHKILPTMINEIFDDSDKLIKDNLNDENSRCSLQYF